ncbi:MAG: metallophosphoesterase [Planctomycetota bacterium]
MPSPHNGVFAKRGRAFRLSRRLASYGVPLVRRTGFMRRLYRPFLESLRTPHIAFEIERLSPLFAGYRIAQVSDIHAGLSTSAHELRSLVEIINDARPDLIVLTGDLISYGSADLPYLLPMLESLRARDGLFAVPGNHEYFSHDAERVIAAYEGVGVRVLRNSSVRIVRRRHGLTGSLLFAGIDDGEEGRPSIEQALAGRREGEPAVLLAHEPDAVFLATRHDVDLQLSGHTHGGQIRLPILGAPLTCSPAGFVSGLYRVGCTHLYVSRGVGAVTLPCRIGAPPEVPLVELQPQALTRVRLRRGLTRVRLRRGLTRVRLRRGLTRVRLRRGRASPHGAPRGESRRERSCA